MRGRILGEDRQMLCGVCRKLANLGWGEVIQQRTFLSGMSIGVRPQTTRAVERLATIRTLVPRRRLRKPIKLWRGRMGVSRGGRRGRQWRDLRTVKAVVSMPEVGLIMMGELSCAPVRGGTGAPIMARWGATVII